MKAVISTTLDDKYFFFVPIVSYCWGKLGVDVMCFLSFDQLKYVAKCDVVIRESPNCSFHYLNAPEHKQATYAQCSRLYASAILELSEDDILITSDVDMAVFKIPPRNEEKKITIWGSDLTPMNQYPMCYATASVKHWRELMETNGRTYNKCLDDLLGEIEAENFRGNYWAKDQEELFKRCFGEAAHVPRAREGTQFANHRIDRDDAFWQERLSPDIIDAHLWRDGFEFENFQKIMKLLQYMYPYDNFTWLEEYRYEYIKCL